MEQAIIPSIIPIPGFSEPVSSMTHLFGTVPFTVAAGFLIWHTVKRKPYGNNLFWVCVLIFASLFMLSMSGVYHLLEPGGDARAVLQRLDHAAIFVMIAGTFSVAHAILFRGLGRWLVLAIMWAAVATAISLKSVFFNDFPEWFGLILYLGFGWLGFASGGWLWRRYGYRFIRPLLWGGIAYSIGAVAEFMGAPWLWPGVFGPHEFFHVMVLVGLACHWAFIWQFCQGRPLTEDEKMQELNASQIEAIIKRGVPLFEDLGIRVEAVSDTEACVRLPYATRLLRPGGSVSGPALMAVIDSAMYALILKAIGREEMALTSDIQLRFLRRAAATDVIGKARFLKQGSRLLSFEVELFSKGEKEPCVHATGSYVMPHPDLSMEPVAV